MNSSKGTKAESVAKANYQRIVVKIGSRLVGGDSNVFNRTLIESLADEIMAMRKAGKQLILVSSGAVLNGMQVLGLSEPPDSLPLKQACSATGQARMMQQYQEIFNSRGVEVAQILISRDGLDNRQRYVNARQTLETLLDLKVLPIINENDTVAIEELGFSDNDHLSALVASKMEADLLVLLSDVDGIYRDRDDPQTLIEEIDEVTPEIEGVVGEVPDQVSQGGMITKLAAAQVANQSGLHAVIANGNNTNVLTQLTEGNGRGTWFRSSQKPLAQRKRWIAFGKRDSGGKVHIDAGARSAILNNGSSLLPSGIYKVEGSFPAGDLVRVWDHLGNEVARGLTFYSSEEIDSVKGKTTTAIVNILGKRKNYEVIHRDNLVMLVEPRFTTSTEDKKDDGKKKKISK
jgi:glutamate 5-kinase